VRNREAKHMIANEIPQSQHSKSHRVKAKIRSSWMRLA
jgi:hypothetical protein